MPANDTYESRKRQLQKIAHYMDSLFGVPGTRFRFGLDGLLGLIPGIGDTLTACYSFFIIYQAYRMGIGKSQIAKMLLNTTIDWLVGMIPLVGDIFDFFFKVNRRNLSIAGIGNTPPETQKLEGGIEQSA